MSNNATSQHLRGVAKEVCNKCGERGDLVLAGSVCGICSKALDDVVVSSKTEVTDWIFVVRRKQSEGRPNQYQVFHNTSYAEMKRNWAAWANHSEAAFFVPFVSSPGEVPQAEFMFRRPATPMEIANYELPLANCQAAWEESIFEKWGIEARDELICYFGHGERHDDVVLLAVLHAEVELKNRLEQVGLPKAVGGNEVEILSFPEIRTLLERVELPDLKPDAAAMLRKSTEVPFDGNWEGYEEKRVKGLDSAYERLCTRLETQAAARPQRALKPLRGLSQVVGMADLKRQLSHEIIGPFRNPDLYRRYRLSVPNGILFFGPPGCGKTYIARCLAEELGFFIQYCRPSDVASPYIHDTVSKIRALFTAAIGKAPSVLFIDEFEAFVPARSELGGFQQYKAEEVNEFLANLEGCAEREVLVVAATNEPWKIDQAVLRPGRFDKHILISPPDAEARAAMLAHYLAGRPVVKPVDRDGIAAVLDWYSAADIKFLADEAARMALAQSALISTETLLAAMGRVPPRSRKKTTSDTLRFGLAEFRGPARWTSAAS